MLIHIATVTFNESADEARIAAFQQSMERMLGGIPQVRSYWHGPNVGDRSTHADYGVVVEFADVNDFETYRQHPAHKAFIEGVLAPLSQSWSGAEIVASQ